MPHLPGTGAHGATRWLGADKALVQMSIRYRWDDIFWFSLFHELGHVLLHRRKSVFIERDGSDGDEQEHEADRFAGETLIPSSAYLSFLRADSYHSGAGVQAFALSQGIAASIVVGRLKHDGHIPHANLNGLRSRFAWATTGGDHARG
jgi:hypothetical protein